ncbi:MAG TPA: glutamate synthase large subunit [Anaerolineae bacterium]|nr:glutamate synthase large subunit [Anaerolineae bacterium]
MSKDNADQPVGLPAQQGLYDPKFEHDACGVGFVVNIKGKKSHQIVQQALTVLQNLTHRGATGAETNTGDGAGILMQLPHKFLKKVCAELGIELPEPGQYGAGIVFLPPGATRCQACEDHFAKIVAEEGQHLLGWRTVPTDNSSLGETAKSVEPIMRQVFIRRDPSLVDEMAFERKLYVIRKRAQREIRYSGNFEAGKFFYVASLSYKTLVYKGMLMPEQLPAYYPDLADPDLESALALVHSRFSTNTFPSWERAHPYRYIIHNGEINTLRGNINWIHAQQTLFESPLFGPDIKKTLPIVNPDGSDSAMFDNVLEFLTLAGRSLPHVVMMMIPEPWSNHESMSDEKKAFYEYHSTLMEPWDGPASIGFTDGSIVGAVLDRNGLRPSRYYVTKDDLVIMASEVGVLEVPPENVLYKGRLEPGRMFLVDTEAGRIIHDEELKRQMATTHPYRTWLDKYLVTLESLPLPTLSLPPAGQTNGKSHANGSSNPGYSSHSSVIQRQQAFGYTFEDLRLILGPMARDGVEPLGAMGNDAPLAVLSDRPRLLYDYFKQLFAQVTNPPIDAIREELITATEVMLGAEHNLLEPGPESARQINLKHPILTDEELAKLRYINQPGFKALTLPILFKPAEGAKGLEQALETLYQAASQAIEQGYNILILSDRGLDREQAGIPALLAVSGLHHHLIREGSRIRAALILESGEPREVHHFAALIGYGISAINPYLAYETLADMIQQNMLTGLTYAEAVKKYIKASVKGVVKTLSKMGISTIQSYCGAQIFEAIGLQRELVDKYFTWTPSRIGGIGLDIIAKEVEMRHNLAFPERQTNGHTLEVGGEWQWRRDGEHHVFNPQTIHLLQKASRTNNYQTYQAYAELINNQSTKLGTLRGLLQFKNRAPIPLDEVEPVESICKRFKTGAMSYGSISQEAHESLAIAMNRIGGRSNTGEGGEDPARYTPEANGDSKNSAIKQVASGRFGVTSQYLVNAREIQIKMAQGAKPGEGGQLPGRKVYPWVAKVRHSTPGVGLISPPPHHDIYSIEDLAELIHDLKNANSQARINVKLVSEVGVGTIAAGVAKGHADVVLISGYDGGTGASPRSSIKHAGLPWELGLAETHQTLVLNNLRSRIVVETDGQLKTGRDVAIAALLGAEEFGFSTAPLVTLGCTMMRVCHLDTCPVGVATQNPELRKKFSGDPAYVVNFMHFVAQELREIMAELGFRTVNEMIGRTDKLEMRPAVDHWKAAGLDFSNILYQPAVPPEVGRYCQIEQQHGLEKSLDRQVLLELCRPALEKAEPVAATLPIRNTNRVVGTILGSELTRRYGAEGLPEDTIRLRFHGSAGQSLGAFVPNGITLVLEGDANDYVGKGLSGGKIIVYPPADSTFVAEENIIIGNVAFYGATGGEAYIRGLAGERFCVRNSGVQAVVEGVGDHGCEYMTGGRVVVLGKTGRNFAAGMSGGIAYILDWSGDFHTRCNREMVNLEKLSDPAEIEAVAAIIRRHAEYTDSELALRVLANWSEMVPKFVKVMPIDYKRMLEAIEQNKAAGLSGEAAVMTAFEQNKNDQARVSGN